MASAMNKILIIGGTAGIGAACAERFHKLGKKLVITGRNETRLSELEKSLPGTETYKLDMLELSKLGDSVEAIMKEHQDLDTVWINGGIMTGFDIKTLGRVSDQKLQDEVTTNLTAPILIARHVIPILLSKKSETTIMLTGSGLGFQPVGMAFPTYCSTKSALHTFAVGIRQALKQTSVNVIELVPPFVATDLAIDIQDLTKSAKPLTLDEYVTETFGILESTPAQDLKEVAAGSAKNRVAVWRDSIGKVMAESGLGD